MNENITIEVSLISILAQKPKRMVLNVAVAEWEQVQRLPLDLRMDYLHRMTDTELLRPQIRRVDVKVICVG